MEDEADFQELDLYSAFPYSWDRIPSHEERVYISMMIDCGIVVERICRLPRDFRLDGAKSVVQLAEEIGLPDHRDCITSSAVDSLLRTQAELVDDWLLWSADQRRSPAWYFREDGDGYVVGYSPDGKKKKFTDPVSACTEYIIQEVGTILATMTS